MRISVRAARGLATFVLVYSSIIAFCHLIELSPVYRPFPGGPATHFYTAIVTGLLAVGLLLVRPDRRVSGGLALLFLVVGGFVFLRLCEMFAVLQLGAPDWVMFELFPAGSDHGATGVNTLATGLLIAGGQLLRSSRPRVGLALATLAPMLPLIAVFGYAFGLPVLYGEMSPVTTTLLLPLSLVGLVSFARRPVLRPLFGSSYFGRSARVEFLAGLGFPLVVGALIAQRNPEGAADTAIQAALMALFAATVVVVKTRAHAATELQRQRMVRALHAAAVTDSLTGLANRHGAAARIEALGDTRPVGVILADLDNFKKVNDIWGHAAGDRVLVDVAKVLRRTIGSNGIVARWGGEEFLMILPGRDLEASLDMAETLRAEVARLRGPAGRIGEITASFGVSRLFAQETSLDGAMYRADVALYGAKDTGRDRVVRDACADCSAASLASFRRDRLLSDEGAMGCGCPSEAPGRLENASTASTPDLGNWN